MGLLQKFKFFCLSLFLKFLRSDVVTAWFRRSFTNTSKSRDIKNLVNPYAKIEEKRSPIKKDPVIITGRFRSGSTLLWNIFRQLEGFTAYYEPFNERRWFDDSSRGDYTDETHRGVSDYWREYKGLDILGQHYSEDWIRWRLFMDEKDFDLDMTRFLRVLVERSHGTPVLQFNRVDFRLGWLRQQFPSAPILHIYRNPRDQWCSTLRADKSYTKDSQGRSGFNDRFYLESWVRDLCCQFPFLADYESYHRYYQFYFLWKLSYCYGKHYCDFSVSLEDLTADPELQIARLLSVVAVDTIPQKIDLSFIEKPESVWRSYADESWFQEIEKECESVLDEFLLGKEVF